MKVLGMYTKILVPLDGSLSSQQALDHARPLAAAHGAELVLLMVSEEGDTPQDAYLAGLRRDLEAEGLKARPLLVTGKPAQAIIETVARESIDLVVIASYSESDYDRWTRGSVPGRLLEAACCPVMIVWTGPKRQSS